MTQGYEATHSGAFLEDLFKREMRARNFLFRTHGEDMDNLDLFAPRVVVSRVPYQNLYDSPSYSEFVITDTGRKIRVECKWQSEPGSVDEKFPYLIRNMAECAPEPEALILYGGNGARASALNWLKREAERIATKKIHVVNVNDFPAWVKREFVNSRAYRARDDFAKSIDACYGAVRERVAAGGPGWEPKA